MASTNKKVEREKISTHGGGIASRTNAKEKLRRSVLSCMLFEDNFYEDGISVSDRITEYVKEVDSEYAAKIMIEAKNDQKLRHAPLWIAKALAEKGELKADDLNAIINRADDITEFIAMYWKNGKKPIPKQIQKGLAKAFMKFDEYQFSKYNRKKEIRFRDVIRLVHPKSKDAEKNELLRKIAKDELKSADTWENKLSDGQDKKTTFEGMLKDKTLGDLAFLRNIRLMSESGVSKDLMKASANDRKWNKILPFQFITAAKHNPDFESMLESAFLIATKSNYRIPGKTIVIVDVSGSMYGSRVSAKSELDRAEVACSLAMVAREAYEDAYIYATAGSDSARKHQTQKVPARHGFALKDAIHGMCRPLGGGGIFVKQVLDFIFTIEKSAERIIIITDEQDCDDKHSADSANYFGNFNFIINVGNYADGVAYNSKAVHIHGWSEKVIDFMREYELSEMRHRINAGGN